MDVEPSKVKASFVVLLLVLAAEGLSVGTGPPPAEASFAFAASSLSSTPLATQVRYEYDGLNRLRRVYCDDGDLGRYDYDASGRRIFRDADLDHDRTLETHVRYVFDGEQEIEEYESGTLAREYVFGNYVDEPLWMGN